MDKTVLVLIKLPAQAAWCSGKKHIFLFLFLKNISLSEDQILLGMTLWFLRPLLLVPAFCMLTSRILFDSMSKWFVCPSFIDQEWFLVSFLGITASGVSHMPFIFENVNLHVWVHRLNIFTPSALLILFPGQWNYIPLCHSWTLGRQTSSCRNKNLLSSNQQSFLKICFAAKDYNFPLQWAGSFIFLIFSCCWVVLM